MLKTIAICMACFFTWSTHASANDQAKDIHARATRAITEEAASQNQYQNWSDKKEEVSSEIRDLKAMDSWLEFQNTKYAKYIQKQETVIAELQRRKEEAKRISMELEPFLETIVNRLEQFVAQDLPFLSEERNNRIRFLHESLDDYHLSLSEKLRRVFEALQVEMEYDRNVASTNEEMLVDGIPTRVSIFRLGRTALFYQTADGSSAGVWNRQTSTWQPLDATYSTDLSRAREMASRQRSVELITLPVEAVQ
ncbi:DUF3450 domain-containing protein [Pseudodesulfovibrio piezophilus]|uniref:TonB system biopolymer transport component n=1 Tax=Pseudodesulfovibrio piezophilus (strain DSM 21447 / JCM 15486 / C1TLV30) TaxID=1322246 RepID=M1WL64_PSEP2|nr:DUF3450 domain-containing protein [Pseudodesulfovibrio piezophilus]CCH47320.1 conserved exported protein of unknown function [Pseudodesulfovibrio piezophilus C1TLV30]